MHTIDVLKTRILKLQRKDPVMNTRLINKLQRKVRALEKE